MFSRANAALGANWSLHDLQVVKAGFRSPTHPRYPPA
jgi:hypothetical protein